MERLIKAYKSMLIDFRDTWHLPILSADFRVVSDVDPSVFSMKFPEFDDVLTQGLSGEVVDVDQIPFVGLRSLVFSPDGLLHESPNPEAIFALRQLSRFSKKIFEVCEPAFVSQEVSDFIEIDASLGVSNIDSVFRTVLRQLHGRDLFRIASLDVYPYRHGPGATAERCDSVSKWDFPTVSERIAARCDIADFFPAYSEEWPVPLNVPVSRLTAVPKTALKPRLICIEPSASMFFQQGIQTLLSDMMSRKPQVNPRDQTQNQRLARKGSMDGSLATIDLSAASDRVSMDLIRGIFEGSFLELLEDARTPFLEIEGDVLELKKFTPMGSALTFPIQMLVFQSIVIGAIVRAEGDVSSANIRRWGRSADISIFGDDIIVPTEYYDVVTSALSECGLKVNLQKSFSTGLFRESCGKDYYAGFPVNPVYLRRNPPTTRDDVDSITSMAATATLLWERGLYETARTLTLWCEDLVGPLGSNHDGLSSPVGSVVKRRFNARLQRSEVLALVPSVRRKKTIASNSAQLSMALFHAGSSDIPDPDRVTHHSRPTSAHLKRRWVLDLS